MLSCLPDSVRYVHQTYFSLFHHDFKLFVQEIIAYNDIFSMK